MIYLYGAGGHAKVIADILERNGMAIGGFFDDDTSKELWHYKGFKFPGSFNFSADKIIIAIGNNITRKMIAEKINAAYFTAVHPTAVISPHVKIGAGTVVMASAVINADSVIGRHCIINSAASIDHDCTIGDFVHIAPNVTLCGGVTVAEATQIGAGSVIIPGIEIGAHSIIGAGAVIIRDIPDNVVVAGNPGRIIK